MTVPFTPPDAGHPRVNQMRLASYRLERVRDALRQSGFGACVLFDPVNVRYATNTTNMSVWCLHNAARYCFVAVDGPVIMFEPHGCSHLSKEAPFVDDVRPARSWFHFASGPRITEHAEQWAAEIADLLHTHARSDRCIAIDRVDPEGVAALANRGIRVADGQAILESARLIKSADEIDCMIQAIDVAQTGMQRMQEALHPGMTELQLWAILHQTNIEAGGEWIETRLLTSGTRTNPWMQECSHHVIGDGDLVSFDTDMIGPHGYCADISRCYLAGDRPATPVQRNLYALAVAQIEHNIDLLKPGMSFREVAERAWPIPAAYAANRYSCILHGIGLCDEYPNVCHQDDFQEHGYDGLLQTGMTVCVESYIGAEGGHEGVKLEQQVLLTDKSTHLLSTYPLETRLLN